jgi:hypothetical protein
MAGFVRSIAVGVTFLLTTAAAPLDLSGAWTLDLEPDFSGHETSIDCTFEQDAQRLTLRCGDAPAWTGQVVERKVTWQFKTGRSGEVTATFTGDVNENGKQIDGTWRLSAAESRDGKFTARKNP